MGKFYALIVIVLVAFISPRSRADSPKETSPYRQAIQSVQTLLSGQKVAYNGACHGNGAPCFQTDECCLGYCVNMRCQLHP